MNTLIRAEFFRLIRSGVLLLTVVVLLVCDLFLSSRSKVSEANMYALPELCTMSEYLGYCDANQTSVGGAKALMKSRGAFESSDATDLIGVFQDTHPQQFRWVLASNKGLLAIPLIFAILFLARDFSSRSFYNALYTGHSRRAVFLSKALFLFVLAFLLSLAGIAALTGVYAGTVFSRLPAAYVWSRLALHALVDCALIAPCLLFCCLLRGPVLSGAASAVYCVLLRFTNLIWPAALKANTSVWVQDGNVTLLLLSALIFLAVSFLGSWLAFEKMELK